MATPIDVTKLDQGQQPLDLASYSPLNTLQQSIMSDAKTAADEVTNATTRVNDFESEINKLAGDISGEAQYRSDLENNLQIPQKNQRLSDIEGQAYALSKTLDNALIQSNQQARGTGEMQSFLDTRQQNIRENAAIGINSLAAESAMLRGNIDTAQNYVDRAVDAKYSPMKQKLELQKFNLDRADKYFDNAQQKQAAAKKQQIEFEMNRLNKAEDEEKQAKTLAIQLGTNNAPSSIVQKAMTAKNITEVLSIPGATNYLVDPMDRRIKSLTAQKLQADIDKIHSDIAKDSNPKDLEAKKDALKSVKVLVNELQTTRGKAGAVGVSLNKLLSFGKTIPGTPAADYRAAATQLINTLASANLDKLKGSMSDKDIEFLRSIGTSLNFGMSESAWDTELKKLNAVVDTNLQKNGIDPKDVVNPITQMSNDEFLSVPSDYKDNSQFFSK